jgi:hypothetical protein
VKLNLSLLIKQRRCLYNAPVTSEQMVVSSSEGAAYKRTPYRTISQLSLRSVNGTESSVADPDPDRIRMGLGLPDPDPLILNFEFDDLYCRSHSLIRLSRYLLPHSLQWHSRPTQALSMPLVRYR